MRTQEFFYTKKHDTHNEKYSNEIWIKWQEKNWTYIWIYILALFDNNQFNKPHFLQEPFKFLNYTPTNHNQEEKTFSIQKIEINTYVSTFYAGESIVFSLLRQFINQTLREKYYKFRLCELYLHLKF